MASTVTRRLLGEGAWVVVGQIASALGTLVGVRLLTEFLPPRVFGEVVLLTGIAAFALGLSAGPLMQAVLRYYPEAAATDSVARLRTVASKCLLRFTLWTGVICLAGFLIYSGMATVSPWLGVLFITLLAIDVLRQFELTLFSAARRQRPTAIWLAAEAWARPAMALAAVELTGATSAVTVAGYVAASLLIFVIFACTTKREGVQNVVFDSRRTHAMAFTYSGQPHGRSERLGPKEKLASLALIRYALPLMPLGLLGWISGQADRYLIGGMIGIEEAGLYAALYGTVSRPFLMTGAILEMWMRPVYYEAVLANEPAQEKKLLAAWIVATICTALAGFAVFWLLNEEIASLLLAQPYRANSALMPWIAAGYGLLLVAQVYVRACYAHNDTKAVLAAETTGSLSALIVTAAALIQFGMAGAAYAVPVYFSVQLGVAMNLAHRTEGRRPVDLWAHERSSA